MVLLPGPQVASSRRNATSATDLGVVFEAVAKGNKRKNKKTRKHEDPLCFLSNLLVQPPSKCLLLTKLQPQENLMWEKPLSCGHQWSSPGWGTIHEFPQSAATPFGPDCPDVGKNRHQLRPVASGNRRHIESRPRMKSAQGCQVGMFDNQRSQSMAMPPV